MTYREYFTAVLGRFGVEPALISVILANQKLNESDVVDVPTAELAMYEEASSMIGGVSSISENGFSISWSESGFLKWYSLLANKLGKENLLSTNIISEESDIW